MHAYVSPVSPSQDEQGAKAKKLVAQVRKLRTMTG
jgi:hypothetical protein